MTVGFLAAALALPSLAWAELVPPKLERPLVASVPRNMQHLNMQDPRVTVVARIGETGKIEDYVCVQATHHGLLDRAEKSLSRARVIPAQVDGKPIAADLQFVVYFSVGALQEESVQFQTFVDHLESRQYLQNPDRDRYELLPVRELDEPLKVVSEGRTVVPATEEGERVAGRAMVEVIVDREGRPRLPRIVESSGEEVSEAAFLTVASWRFNTPTRGGKPGAVRVRVPVVYSLEEATSAG